MSVRQPWWAAASVGTWLQSARHAKIDAGPVPDAQEGCVSHLGYAEELSVKASLIDEIEHEKEQGLLKRRGTDDASEHPEIARADVSTCTPSSSSLQTDDWESLARMRSFSMPSPIYGPAVQDEPCLGTIELAEDAVRQVPGQLPPPATGIFATDQKQLHPQEVSASILSYIATTPLQQPKEREALNFLQLTMELQTMILLYLAGQEAAAAAQTSAPISQLLEHDDVWKIFLEQEFPEQKALLLEHDHSQLAYIAALATSSCRSISWRQLPCRHALGSREGSPGMFSLHGFLFVFGGWGSMGARTDLHVGLLQHPLHLQRMDIAGPHPPATYEMKVTVLADQDITSSNDPSWVGAVRVMITGGYMFGGYAQASNMYAILEVNFHGYTNAADSHRARGRTAEDHATSTDSEDQPLVEDDRSSDRDSGPTLPTARFIGSGRMVPRANHTATYVPPRVAGSHYPRGYVLVFGGIINGDTCNQMDLLDLETMNWELDKHAEGEPPAPRNSHSATLVTRSTGQVEVLIAGGGTGDDNNGGPPRGGIDRRDAYWLNPLTFEWSVAEVHLQAGLGRGHIAFPLGSTVVFFSGGASASRATVALTDRPRAVSWEVTAAHQVSPQPRGFGGGCCLPDGSMVLFGGWHRRQGTYGDFWVGHVQGFTTQFVSPLTGEPAHRASSCKFTNERGLRGPGRDGSAPSQAWTRPARVSPEAPNPEVPAQSRASLCARICRAIGESLRRMLLQCRALSHRVGTWCPTRWRPEMQELRPQE